MNLIINPGSGPVEGAFEQEAVVNIGKFMEESGASGAEREPGRDDGRGRFAFRLSFADGRSRLVEMPGLPLDRVRYVRAEGQNVWNFPWLYVDGDSWHWLNALNMVRRAVE